MPITDVLNSGFFERVFGSFDEERRITALFAFGKARKAASESDKEKFKKVLYKLWELVVI